MTRARRRRTHYAKKYAVGRSTDTGARPPEHELVPDVPASPPPMEREAVKQLLAENYAKWGWDREPFTERPSARTPRRPLTEAEIAEQRARVQEALEQLRTLEISKNCETGEHEKCARCGCACHVRAA